MATVGSELRRLFARGTVDTSRPNDISLVPEFPADVFAAGAHLLASSGAYQYIVAPFGDSGGANVTYPPPTSSPSLQDLDRWRSIGRDWAENPEAGAALQKYWELLLAASNEPLVAHPRRGENPPTWWAAAHALLVIADEASGDTGYHLPASSGAVRWANELSSIWFESSTERRVITCADLQDKRHVSRHVALDSLADLAEREVCRVLPKGRTTELGCTLRTFSHNLTLLPPHGRSNAYWHQSHLRNVTPDDTSLHVLLIPFPFEIPNGSFHGEEGHVGSGGKRWGRFCLHQKWLDLGDKDTSITSFVGFVSELLRRSAQQGTVVHGVVLPEYALDWATYDALVRHLRDYYPDIEFVISGVSDDCTGRPGNQVTFSMFHQDPGGGPRVAQTHSRRKHHRWQLDRSQIEGYGLDADLDPSVTWWEYLEVEERVLHIDVFRERSTMTAVICEDLARVDPGLALLRSIGANLVFALLMDGPQLKSRWPGVYATGLADDPGSSVLSFTSMGLIRRSNEIRRNLGKPVKDPCVALWRNRPRPGSANPSRDFVEINLTTGECAAVVCLKAEPAHDTTLDGRPNTDTMAWYLENITPIKLDKNDIHRQGWEWIIGRSPTE